MSAALVWLRRWRLNLRTTRALKRERARFLRVVAAAIEDKGALVIVAWLDTSSAPRIWRERAASYAQGTGTRHLDRAIVKTFDTEYRRVALQGE